MTGPDVTGPDLTGPVTVRDARPDDLETVVGLLAAGSLRGGEDPGDLAPYRAALEEITARDDSAVLVAERGGRVVGVCQLITFRHLQQRGGRCAELESMHVAADVRSGGIGGVLVEAAVERAAQMGCYRVQLTSNKARSDAHRFYLAHGFEASHEGFKRFL